MNVNVQAHHVALPPHAGSSLAARAKAFMARLQKGVARLDMTLKDINGPRGGRDKVCMIRAELADGGQVVVIDRDSSLRRAIGRALTRTRRLVSAELQKRQARRRERQRIKATRNGWPTAPGGPGPVIPS